MQNFDILKLQERIDIAIQLGESHFREFKSALEGPQNKKKPRAIKEICTDIGQTLVAFANADGGELLVGVEDDGTVSGVDFDDEKIGFLMSAPKNYVHKDTPLPSVKVNKVIYQSKTVLYFSVGKGIDYIYLTSTGRCLQRKDMESPPISAESIKLSRDEIVSREYDRKFIENADVDDLDPTLVKTIADHISKGMSAEKCLQHLELAEFDGTRLRLKRAALLLFAKKPSKWHPRLQVRLLKVNGTEIKSGENFNVVFDDEVTDNILNLRFSSWELLRPHLTETRFSKEAVFSTQIIYPELACREALINAIAHRDYSAEGRGIEVRIFSDRLEILSPGELLSSIKLQDLISLKGVHQSRNSLVARVLREAGYMRELGEGIVRIFELMRSNDLTPPVLSSENGVFKIILYHKYMYSKEEKIWLDSFDKYSLSREQKTVVRLGYNGRLISPKDIWDEVGIVDTDVYRQLLESLRKLGILHRGVSKTTAYQAAKNKKIPKKSVPQFSIQVPSQKLSVCISSNDFDDDSEYAKVFVHNVPYSTDEANIIDAFSRFGEVVDVKIPKNHETGLKRGFAFVEFEKLKSAEKALKASGNIDVSGRKVFVSEFKEKDT